MAEPSSQERHLPPTERKRRKAREEGQVARSRDLGHFAAIAAGGSVLAVAAAPLASWLTQRLADGLRFDAAALAHPAAMAERLGDYAWTLLAVVLPLGAVLALVALASGVATGGWNWTFKPVAPKFGKLDPIKGVARLVSKQQLIDALKASLLALVLGSIGALYLGLKLESFSGVLALPLAAAVPQVGSTVLAGLAFLVLALAAFALVDVPLQRHLHTQRLKMSHQEMKQETKEAEGNVEVKAKVRARMREMANRRMLAAVPGADLVVMNPTHYAVALKYDEAKMAAPRVVAKGADLMALRIRDSARDAQVPVLQSPPLARALYAHAEIDREIPAALFAAVAQVLAYVYQLRAALAGRGAMPGEPPAVEVPPELDPHRGAGAPA